MSKGNKKAKAQLERIFGKVDMFVAANCEQVLENLNIRGYKKFERELRFKGAPISQQLTFHHLRHRSEGGDASPRNGALIGQTRHQYLHSLSREEEEIANNLMREWKINAIAMTGKGEILDSISYTPDFSDFYTIPAYDNSKSEKYRRLKHPDRAAKKRETAKMIKDYEDEEFEK